LQLVHEEAAGELYELAERVRKIVALGPEQLERQYEGERIVRELVCRRMRRWNAKHPWVAPPPVWDRGKPGYEESKARCGRGERAMIVSGAPPLGQYARVASSPRTSESRAGA